MRSTGISLVSVRAECARSPNSSPQGSSSADRARRQADYKILATLNRWDNPFMQFWMFRGAPALNIATGVAEQATGTNVDPFRDITSLPDLVRHIGTSALPFSLQGALEGEEALTVAAALMGARTSVIRDQQPSPTRPRTTTSPARSRSRGTAPVRAHTPVSQTPADYAERQALVEAIR